MPMPMPMPIPTPWPWPWPMPMSWLRSSFGRGAAFLLGSAQLFSLFGCPGRGVVRGFLDSTRSRESLFRFAVPACCGVVAFALQRRIASVTRRAWAAGPGHRRSGGRRARQWFDRTRLSGRLLGLHPGSFAAVVQKPMLRSRPPLRLRSLAGRGCRTRPRRRLAADSAPRCRTCPPPFDLFPILRHHTQPYPGQKLIPAPLRRRAGGPCRNTSARRRKRSASRTRRGRARPAWPPSTRP